MGLKKEVPSWGAPKTRDKLIREYPMIPPPAVSTIHAALDRNGLVKRRKRRRHKACGTPLSAAHAPNGLWCADYKGEFLLGNRQYCYPLTIFERYNACGLDGLYDRSKAPYRQANKLPVQAVSAQPMQGSSDRPAAAMTADFPCLRGTLPRRRVERSGGGRTMRRRAFCVSAAAALGAAAFPFGRAFSVAATVTTDVEAVTGDGRRILLSRSDVEEFRAGLRGQLLLRDAAGYDDARKIFNGMFDRKPAMIARCLGAADVVRSVRFAHAHGLLVAVRGGGHSLSGQSVCDDGLMIDLAPMRGVRVDPVRRLARAAGGALLGDLDRETLAFGLVTTTGTVSHTGVGGLTLGGGFGRLARRYGLTCDQLTSVDIVTADGRLLEASATANDDLFWGVRGGGGNFGVVTSFEFRLHPFDGWATGGHLVFPFEQARQALRGFAELYPRAPDGLWIEPILTTAPGGARVLILDVCCTDPPAAAEAALVPYRKLGKAIEDGVKRVRYAVLQTKDDERARIGGRYYTKSGFTNTLDDGLIDLMLDTIGGATIPRARIAMPPKGGAIQRVAPDATAFWHRAPLYSVLLQTSGDEFAADAANLAWAKAKWPALEAHTTGYYANTNLSEMPADRVGEAYGGNQARLTELKTRYDPTNLFRLNANVRPRA